MGSSSVGKALVTIGTGGTNLIYDKLVTDPAKAQQNAQNQALAASKATATQADIATNRANQKTPDIGAMLAGNQQAAQGGISGTMLTGPSGIDPTTLQLGKNTLLGS